MLEQISSQVTTILSLSVCGISLGAIIGMVIYCIRVAIKNRRYMKVTVETIENAFKNVILPKNIKIDVSNKIEKPIKEGLTLIADKLSDTIERVEKGEQLILQILVLFTHFQKLPNDVREEIEDFIAKESAVNISL